jgi:hypothetical protein
MKHLHINREILHNSHIPGNEIPSFVFLIKVGDSKVMLLKWLDQ